MDLAGTPCSSMLEPAAFIFLRHPNDRAGEESIVLDGAGHGAVEIGAEAPGGTWRLRIKMDPRLAPRGPFVLPRAESPPASARPRDRTACGPAWPAEGGGGSERLAIRQACRPSTFAPVYTL